MIGILTFFLNDILNLILTVITVILSVKLTVILTAILTVILTVLLFDWGWTIKDLPKWIWCTSILLYFWGHIGILLNTFGIPWNTLRKIFGYFFGYFWDTFYILLGFFWNTFRWKFLEMTCIAKIG